MQLDGLLRKYLRKGNTGQLVIKFKEDPHLCKIYIEDGEPVYLLMGNKRPEEVLESIQRMNPEEANFIEGVRTSRRLDASVFDRFDSLLAGTGPIPDSGDIEITGTVPPHVVDKLIEDFIDIIGPLGSVIAEKLLSRIGYNKEEYMDPEDYKTLLSGLVAELPDDYREDFKNRHTGV